MKNYWLQNRQKMRSYVYKAQLIDLLDRMAADDHAETAEKICKYFLQFCDEARMGLLEEIDE